MTKLVTYMQTQWKKWMTYIQEHLLQSIIVEVCFFFCVMLAGGGWVWLAFIPFLVFGVILCRSFRDLWDTIFCASCIICLCYFAIPKLLEANFFYGLIDRMFEGLRYAEYKSTFAESIGALLGTATAIIGALWTQHYFEREEEKKNDLTIARIIYYDLRFAFNEIRGKIHIFAFSCGINFDEISYKTLYSNCAFRYFHGYRVYFDNQWIHTVAKLPESFSRVDIDTIYHIYGLFNSLNLVLTGPGGDTRKQIAELCSELYSIIPDTAECQELLDNPFLVEQREKTQRVYEKLERIVGVEINS